MTLRFFFIVYVCVFCRIPYAIEVAFMFDKTLSDCAFWQLITTKTSARRQALMANWGLGKKMFLNDDI